MRRYNRGIATLSFVAVFGGCAALVAQIIPVPEKTFDAASIPSGTYKLDKSHANLTFEVSHMGFSTYVGRFNNLDASFTFEAEHPERSRLDARIETASIDTNDPVLEKELKSSKFFDASQYPEITFQADGIDLTGQDTGRITGKLAMHGVTKPVTLDVKFNGGAKAPMSGLYTMGFSGGVTVKRSDYGISAFVPLVGDEVTIRVNAEFNKAP